jgi:hypothetical protein
VTELTARDIQGLRERSARARRGKPPLHAIGVPLDELDALLLCREALEAINQVPAKTADDPVDLLQAHWAIAGAALAGRPLPT